MVVGELKVQDGFQEKANCPLNLNLNLTHFLTMPQAAGKNIAVYGNSGYFDEN